MKTVSNLYENVCTYIKYCIKIVGLNRSYSTNTQPIVDIPEEPDNLRFAPIAIFEFNNFSFIINIFDNIILYEERSRNDRKLKRTDTRIYG